MRDLMKNDRVDVERRLDAGSDVATPPGGAASVRGAGRGEVVFGAVEPTADVRIAGCDARFHCASAHKLKYSYPLKLFLPRHAGGCSQWLYPMTFGGGLVEADDICLTVDTGDDTCIVIVSQSSTKVFPCPSGRQTTQASHLTVGRRALLAVLPDPVVCFSDAIYSQTQHIQMALEGNLVLLDWLTAGRIARGEVWQFNRYHSLTTVKVEEKIVFRSATRLENSRFLTISAAMSTFKVSGMYLVLGSMLQSYCECLLETYGRVQPYGAESDSNMLVAISPVSYSIAGGEMKGCVIRFAASSTAQAFDLLQQIVEPLFGVLGGNPFHDKF